MHCCPLFGSNPVSNDTREREGFGVTRNGNVGRAEECVHCGNAGKYVLICSLRIFLDPMHCANTHTYGTEVPRGCAECMMRRGYAGDGARVWRAGDGRRETLTVSRGYGDGNVPCSVRICRTGWNGVRDPVHTGRILFFLSGGGRG